MNKRAQAALEFLMTYGWAILVVLAAIGALAYFGVLNPSNFLPNKCVASPGISCVDKPQVAAGFMIQAVTINTGTGITINALPTTVGTSSTQATYCTKGTAPASCTTAFVLGPPATALTDGQTYLIRVPGAFVAGQSVKEEITLTALNPNSGLVDTYVISLSGKI
jgi:hypothetical protein